MKTLSLLTTVMFLTYFVSGCNSPKADTSPNSRKADEGPPLVGPDVQVWKLTLHVDTQQILERISWDYAGGRGRALPIVNADGKTRAMIERPMGQKDRSSFEGVWEAEMRTRDHPSSVVAYSRLTLSPDGQAEYIEEEGHDEFREGSYTEVKYIRERITHHLVGKWKQTSDTTATVWLQPAPLVGPDVQVWKLTLNVAPQGNYTWIDVRTGETTAIFSRQVPEGGNSLTGTWSTGWATEDAPSSYIVSYRLTLSPDGQAEHTVAEGHEVLGASEPIMVEVSHLVGKWKQTSDTTATVWLQPAPLVGPDVEVWKLTLHVDATQNYAWIDVRLDDENTQTLDRLTGPEDVVSFEGTWESGMWTEDYPSSYVLGISLVLDANGGAEYIREEGHEELPGPKYVRDTVIRHLVGKWRHTSDTTATVWLEPAAAL